MNVLRMTPEEHTDLQETKQELEQLAAQLIALLMRVKDQSAKVNARAMVWANQKVTLATSKFLVKNTPQIVTGATRNAVTMIFTYTPILKDMVVYSTSPDGMTVLLDMGASLHMLASLPLAAAATFFSVASVGVSAGGTALHTAAEVVRETGDTGAIRRALKQPDYAKELQVQLAERRRNANKGQFLRRAKTWSNAVNTGVVSRVSPTMSRLFERTGSGLVWAVPLLRTEDGAAAGEPERRLTLSDVAGMLADQASDVSESTKLMLLMNAWTSTELAKKAESLKEPEDQSVELLVGLAGRVGEYGELGWIRGSQAAYGDMFRLMLAGTVAGAGMITPAAVSVANASLDIGKQAAGTALNVALFPWTAAYHVSSASLNAALHPISTISNAASLASGLVSGSPTDTAA